MLLTPPLSGCQESVHRQHLSCARPTCRGLSQVARLGQTAFRWRKVQSWLTHQAEHGQQLRLGALMFAETATVGRQNPLRDFARHPQSKRHQADLGIFPPPHQKTPSPYLVHTLLAICDQHVNRGHFKSFSSAVTKKSVYTPSRARASPITSHNNSPAKVFLHCTMATRNNAALQLSPHCGGTQLKNDGGNSATLQERGERQQT